MMVVLLIVLATVLTTNANVAQQDTRQAPMQLHKHAIKEATRFNGDFIFLRLLSCEGGRSLSSVDSDVTPCSISLCCTGGERMTVWRESSASSVEDEPLPLFVKLDDARGDVSLRGVVCIGRGVNAGGDLLSFSAVA